MPSALVLSTPVVPLLCLVVAVGRVMWRLGDDVA